MGRKKGRGGLTLILSVGEGGTKVKFCLVRGGERLNYEAYFAHFPTPPPPPDNYCVVPYYKDAENDEANNIGHEVTKNVLRPVNVKM